MKLAAMRMRLPRELDCFVADPVIVMTGCQAWPPVPRKDPHLCPVCGTGVNARDHGVYCGWSDEFGPAEEARIRSVRLGIRGRETEHALRSEANQKRRKLRAELTERERRRIWNGYRGGLSFSTEEPTNRARVGREWLKEIGQTPDFSIVLDRHGNEVGRFH